MDFYNVIRHERPARKRAFITYETEKYMLPQLCFVHQWPMSIDMAMYEKVSQ